MYLMVSRSELIQMLVWHENSVVILVSVNIHFVSNNKKLLMKIQLNQAPQIICITNWPRQNVQRCSSPLQRLPSTALSTRPSRRRRRERLWTRAERITPSLQAQLHLHYEPSFISPIPWWHPPRSLTHKGASVYVLFSLVSFLLHAQETTLHVGLVRNLACRGTSGWQVFSFQVIELHPFPV